MTESEKKLWEKLKGKKLGVSAYAQSIVYGYILDFWIPPDLCIEVDGSVHDRRKAYDKRRDGHLRKMGIKTIRFSVEDVMGNAKAVVAIIKFEIAKRK
jgi:very-short-patch-repair endonuclease